MVFANLELGLTLSKSGAIFQKDHSTVIHAIQMYKYDLQYSQNTILVKTYRKLKEAI